MPIVELYENRPVELSGARIHELALQRWLYDNFHVVEGDAHGRIQSFCEPLGQ
jgi:hypothetical protein